MKLIRFMLLMIIVLVISSCLHQNAQQDEYNSQDDFFLEIFNDTLIIICYRGNRRDVRIPPTMWGLPVTKIGERSFLRFTNRSTGLFPPRTITSVAIPDSVTYIGDEAFAGNQLINIDIPDSVTRIGVSAFTWNNLNEVTIPYGVTVIESAAFSNNQLVNVILHSNITLIELGAFENNNLTAIIIPDSVLHIENWAFQSNPLTSITIGNGVEFEQWGDNNSGGFGASFGQFYERMGRRAGTYTYNNGLWSVEFRRCANGDFD